MVEVAKAMGEGNEWGLAFDEGRLERELREAEAMGQGVIVVVTLGEVNTVSLTHTEKGRLLNDSDRAGSRLAFLPSPNCAKNTMHGFISMQVMSRPMCEILANGASTAFGGFAALLPQYQYLVEEMKLADSLTLDGKCT